MTQRRHRSAALVVGLASGCRGEPVVPSEPPQAAKHADAHEGPTATPEPQAPRIAAPEPTAMPLPAGPALAAEAVIPAFGRWWVVFSGERLAAHPLRATLDERVAAGGRVEDRTCDELAEHVLERAPSGSPELLFGDAAALRVTGERCWWVHHDGMMGPGLGSALARDGRVLAIWVVLEG